MFAIKTQLALNCIQELWGVGRIQCRTVWLIRLRQIAGNVGNIITYLLPNITTSFVLNPNLLFSSSVNS